MYAKNTAINRTLQKRKTFTVVSRFRLCFSITIMIAIIISIFSLFLLKGKAQNTPDYFFSRNVSKGDTLWTIAKDSLPKGRDIRDYIAEIREYNKLETSNIKEGQLLKIPVYQEGCYMDESEMVLRISE